MNTSIQNARAILGKELITVLKQTCGDDQRAYEEMLDEALRAFKIMHREYGWKNTMPVDQE